MSWQSPSEQRQEVEERRAKLVAYCEPFNISTPTPFPEENGDQYEDRVISWFKDHVPGFENFTPRDLHRENRKIVLDRFYQAASQEAQRPTKIPDGELRQVTRTDQTGRQYFEFFGSPSSWLKDFAGEKKRLTSIVDNRQWQKV
jgi:hypothetical protein